LRANFFAIKVPKTPIFDYSVDITPKADVKSQSMKSRVFQLLEQSAQMAPHKSHIAHDKGARLVSAQELPQPLNVQLQYHDEGEPLRADAKTLNVEITFVRTLDTTELNKLVFRYYRVLHF
jgi:eukaryotic translation initiation factor 2C